MNGNRQFILLIAQLVLLMALNCSPNVVQAQIKGLGKSLPDAAEVLVYKKWIGAAGDESAVDIALFCKDMEDFHELQVNQDKPDGWVIADLPEQGTYCSVYEAPRDSFIPDDSDCRNLLVLPGTSVECTLVNTKRVKRIEMLNRYGVVMMIAFILGVGLAAVHRQLH